MKCQRGPRERNFVKFYVYKYYENLLTIAIINQSVFEKLTDTLREHLRLVCPKTELSESKSLVLFEAKKKIFRKEVLDKNETNLMPKTPVPYV